MSTQESRHEQVSDEIIQDLQSGPKYLPDLVDQVSQVTHTDAEEVMAAVWELVDQERLDYGVDASLTLEVD